MANLIVVSLFPLIFLILMGYVIKRSGFLADSFWASLEKLNYYILFPAMLFMTLANAKIEFSAISRMMQVVFLALAIVCIVLYSLRFLNKTPAGRFGVYMQSIIRFNSYIGLAIVTLLLGHEGMALFAILIAVCIPLLNILSVFAMTKPEDMNINGIIKSLVSNPLILSCIVGIAFNSSGMSLWIGFEYFLKQLAVCTLPLGLLIVGAALRLNGFKSDLLPLVSNTLARLLIMPFLALGLCYILQLPKLETQVMVLFFALPTASASYILTRVLGGDSELMANIISLQTLCALVSLPLMMYLIL